MVAQVFIILGDPKTVAAKPHTGAIKVNPGRMNKYAKPIVQTYEIGFII
jgi:hypothetical protein